MDDILRLYPAVLTELGNFCFVDPDGTVSDDGLAMLREAMVKAFVEVRLLLIVSGIFTQYEYFYRLIQCELYHDF